MGNELIAQLRHSVEMASHAPFYSKLLKDNNISGETIGSIIDFRKIPFTKKGDIRGNIPSAFLSTSMSCVRRVHSSSGTKGNPTISYYSDSDIRTWQEHLCRAFRMAGLKKGDVFQTIVGFGLFSGGLGFEQAAEQYGMTVVPIGMGNTQRQVEYLRMFHVNGIITISSYLPILANYMKRHDIDPKSELQLKAILIGAEPFHEKTRDELRDFFGVPILSVYGLSELEGPGVAVECPNGNGMHVFTDAYYPEIIDPITGDVLGENCEGELVLTSLKRECMPLLRYRTGDITSLYRTKCECMSEFEWKIGYVFNRSDDMLIIRGVNIYPSQIKDIVYTYDCIYQNLQIVVKKDDDITLKIASKSSEKVENAEKGIIRDIKNWLNVTVKVEWVPTEYFDVAGKSVCVIDERTA